MTLMNTVLKWVKLQKESLCPCCDIPSGNTSCLVFVIWEPRAALLTMLQVSIRWFARNALPWDFNEDLGESTTGSHSALFYLLKHLCLPLPLSSSKCPNYTNFPNFNLYCLYNYFKNQKKLVIGKMSISLDINRSSIFNLEIISLLSLAYLLSTM